MRILTRVLSEGKTLPEALEDVPPGARAWLMEVCSGALRWKGRLDWVIDETSLKKKPTGWLRKILLIGSYQLIAQDRTDPTSVVFETVEEVKSKEGEAPARFANAVLRKVAEHAARWRALPPESAAWGSLPEWLWRKLVEQRGPDWARAYAEASLARPQLWLRGREGSREIVEGGRVEELPGFREGEFFIQDISSQTLVSEIAAEVKRAFPETASLSALDLCAAPGGKSVGLAWNGFEVSAADLGPERIAMLSQTVERTRSNVKIIPRDQVKGLSSQDLVWIDAPCTGTGILRRHPEVRWLRKENELAGLTKIQHELLVEGWEKVRPGGFLAYSVCSVLKEEGIEAIARAGLQARLVKEWLLCPQNPPHGDGFWAGLIRKESGRLHHPQ